MSTYDNQVVSQWCPGCPNFGILQALKKALTALHKSPEQVCLVSGIGQAAKLPHYLHCNFFNGLHGRAIPVATGIHVANPDLTTIVVTGDGDCYGEGGNHFLHALRRNPNLTIIVHNNELYALTKGQASPTTQPRDKRTMPVQGVINTPINMLAVAMIHDCPFVARGYAGEIDHLTDILVKAVRHRGLSVVEIIQPCITWGNKPLTWYQEHIVYLESDYDAGNLTAALSTVMNVREKTPIGILYQKASRSLFAQRYQKLVSGRPLSELKPIDRGAMERILEEFRSTT